MLQNPDIAPAFSQAIIFLDIDAETIAAEECGPRAPGSWAAYMRKTLPPLPYHADPRHGLRLLRTALV